MDKPVNSYTTAVSACDILKNDIEAFLRPPATVIHLNGLYTGKGTHRQATTVDTTKASKLKVDGAAADLYRSELLRS